MRICETCAMRLYEPDVRAALVGLLECFEGFDPEDASGRVMNNTMSWDDVVPRIMAAREAMKHSPEERHG